MFAVVMIWNCMHVQENLRNGLKFIGSIMVIVEECLVSLTLV